MASYVAFLRGINVGGHHKVPMADLREVLEGMGFHRVKTFLASGNVVFEADRQSVNALSKKIATALEKKFGFPIGTFVIDRVAFQRLVDSTPFKGIRVHKDIRLYVTFLAEKRDRGVEIPYTSPDKSLRILSATPTAVFTVLDVEKAKTTDAMKILEKQLGKNVTTRNWNTVLKIAAAGG